jgi:hypothetical protein
MKKQILALGFCSMAFFGIAQTTVEDDGKATVVAECINFRETKALRDIAPILPETEDNKDYTVPNKLRRYKHVNPNALPQGNDPVWQMNKSSHFNKAPIQNWEATSFSAYPPDPSGAVGPNHYVHMVNSSFTIYDKAGATLYGPSQLGTLLGGSNDGDPIVMYDKDADRWFMSQFKSSNNSLQIAISTTPDPTGTFYSYEFALNSFPDYPKYGVWNDSYFVTSNKTAPQFYAMDRTKMLAGDPSASIQGFTIPSLATNGFFSVMPATASAAAPAPGTPGYLYYFQDDGWGGVTADHIKIWEADIDWVTTGNSTLLNVQSLPVSAFDSEFQSSWDDIEQPGTTDKLDGIPTAFMFMAHYREFSGYASVVLNHTVDVSGTDHAGIRWYELRKTGTNPWTLYQEGTFAPDGESRWLGSICMDYQGNIGLAYSVSGPTVYPSIRYTGRYASDPLGQMTLAEEDVVIGNGVQTGPNRWGDYAQMTLDPVDDATFWYTGEYIGNSNNSRKSRVFSFKIANDAPDDLGVIALVDPTNGTLSSAEAVTVTINNFGLNDQAGFPVSYTINGGTPVTETYVGNILSGATAQYTFTGTGNFGTPGVYEVKAYTGLAADISYNNDTTTVDVLHLYPADIGVSAITAPSPAGSTTAAETVTVTVENYGSASQTGFDVSYSINGGTAVTETFSGTLASGANASFSFAATADLSNLDDYDFLAYTSLSGDSDMSNDTSAVTVTHELCQPAGDCSFGDGYTLFNISNVNNITACALNGYGDYTQFTADIDRGVTTDLIIKSGYTNQTSTVWIDFNDNYVFETSERVVINQTFTTTNTTVGLTVPAAAALGPHLMRARTNWNNSGNATINDPCVDVSYGETEDYMANIKEGSGSGVGIDEKYNDLNLTILDLGSGLYTLKIEGLTEDVDVEIHNTIGQKVMHETSLSSNGNFVYSIDLNGNAAGYYLVKVGNANFSKIQKVNLK